MTILTVALLLAAAIAVNLIGVQLLGGIESWERWMDDRAGYFLTWRLLLYAGTVWGWIRMRHRLLARDPDTAVGLRRAEVAAVLAFVALESSTLLRLL